jgi:hypothetical protein
MFAVAISNALRVRAIDAARILYFRLGGSGDRSSTVVVIGPAVLVTIINSGFMQRIVTIV